MALAGRRAGRGQARFRADCVRTHITDAQNISKKKHFSDHGNDL